jgi:hypothetical protein
MKAKNFDCVELQHKGAAAVNRRLRGKSPQAQLEYWRQRADELRQRQRARRKAPRPV